MPEPRIVDRKPVLVDAEAGKPFHWCACGRSANQPYCDGSHAGTGMGPIAVTPDADGKVALCLCKHTGNAPYCDGSHAGLPAD